MAKSDEIQFECPRCRASLSVPLQYASKNGPCPRCHKYISVPAARLPEEVKASQKRSRTDGKLPRTYPSKDLPTMSGSGQPETFFSEAGPSQDSSWGVKRWTLPTVVMPLVILSLMSVVVYSILHAAGMFSPDRGPKKEQTDLDETLTGADPEEPIDPLTAPDPPKPREEPGTEKPVSPPPVFALTLQEEIELYDQQVLSARQALTSFLDAETLERRRLFLTAEDQENVSLENTCLNGPLPPHNTPVVQSIVKGADERSLEIFFTVAFQNEDGDFDQIALVRTSTEKQGPLLKVQGRSFADLFDQRVAAFANARQEKAEAFFSVIEYSNFCLENIPNTNAMAKIDFYSNKALGSKPIATAYLERESDVFEEIKKLGDAKDRNLCVLKIAWDSMTDPAKPFLKVIGLESKNWAIR